MVHRAGSPPQASRLSKAAKRRGECRLFFGSVLCLSYVCYVCLQVYVNSSLVAALSFSQRVVFTYSGRITPESSTGGTHLERSGMSDMSRRSANDKLDYPGNAVPSSAEGTQLVGLEQPSDSDFTHVILSNMLSRIAPLCRSW